MNQLCFTVSGLPRAKTGDLDWPFAFSLADAFLAGGGEYFETGAAYLSGRSEEVVRRALAERHPRGSFRVLDKLPLEKLKSEADCEAVFAQQCQKCGVEYFDVYLLDWLNRERYIKAQELGALEFLARLKAEGKAKRIGISFYGDAETLSAVLSAHPELEIVQLQVNYPDWESEYLQVRACHEAATALGRTVIGTDPFKSGTLTALPETAARFLPAGDASPASWARRFARSHAELVCEAVGTPEALAEAMEPTEPLSETEEKAVRAAGKAFVNSVQAIHCVGCNACTRICPREIPSGDYFRLYNAYSRAPGELEKLRPFYAGLAGERGRASDCVHCGGCEGACPQHIVVTKWLFKTASTFE